MEGAVVVNAFEANVGVAVESGELLGDPPRPGQIAIPLGLELLEHGLVAYGSQIHW